MAAAYGWVLRAAGGRAGGAGGGAGERAGGGNGAHTAVAPAGGGYLGGSVAVVAEHHLGGAAAAGAAGGGGGGDAGDGWDDVPGGVPEPAGGPVPHRRGDRGKPGGDDRRGIERGRFGIRAEPAAAGGVRGSDHFCRRRLWGGAGWRRGAGDDTDPGGRGAFVAGDGRFRRWRRRSRRT